MGSQLFRIYEKVVLSNPRVWLVVIASLMVVFGLHAQNFKLDASADSLVLENDDDLRYFRAINKVYGSDDFLVITYTPFDDLLSERSLEGLRGLKKDLSELARMDSVVSILNVPLLESPKVRISELGENTRTIETPDVDKDMALRELTESPIYRKLLASEDGKTTAILAKYKRDEKYFSLLDKRDDLREKKRNPGHLTAEEEKTLKQVSREFKLYLAELNDLQDREIAQVRAILDKYRDRAKIFLGGVTMITSDMMNFIASDISVFGFGVLMLMILVMWLFFRSKRWVTLPLLCCGVAVWLVIGTLGWLDWRITVISSNFISIVIIITLSLTIHLIVRYGELHAENPGMDQLSLVRETLRLMFQPCFYTSITTVVAFTSLVISGIRPVIDFGWIMTMGISLGFVLAFIIFPSFLSLMSPKGSVSNHDATKKLTHAVAEFSLGHKSKILILTTVLILVCIMGIFKLRVDNRFIDYFKTDTEIYQGMSVIDQKLGGTTPLDIIIEADQDFFDYLKELEQQKGKADVFDDPFSDLEDEPEENFWFHPDKLLEVEKIHDYLEALPEIGKVLSIATTLKVVRSLSEDRVPDDYDLTLYRKLFPEEPKKSFLDPYLSKDANQIRINLRIEETDPKLKRTELIAKIKQFLIDEMQISEDRIRFTGMTVLYNNMLQSLYTSQILTLGMVFLAILFMFFILFRRFYLSLLAMVPNIFSSLVILGLMGWLDIPLDMMTITIASITIGIAVDDTIHYIHRFQAEFAAVPKYLDGVLRCHESIGRAMYYTSITITVGFSILTLSNFIPTINFGLLTGLAMILALLGDLILLPLLIVLFKPLGPELKAA